MPLASGQRLAHYDVLEPIGKGGMGEVYRARDSKLGRDVAIKVLPDEFSANEERLARFEREAKVLASLNHPGIAAIYGTDESESTHYLVLELVPGETLGERISRGPIPRDEALQIALQIAGALEEAHEQGIVHRDLKPANVKLTPDGKVKVLDFGLAKEFVDEATRAGLTQLPTVAGEPTRAGVVMGTAAYMSPEQAWGKPVDKRTDIWSFGCLVYEMLTGRPAFSAEMPSEPDWKPIGDKAPRPLHTLLRRCLQDDPRRRLRDIGDARIEIEEMLEGRDSDARPGRWREALPWATAVLGVVAVLAIFWGASRTPSPGPAQVRRFEIPLPEGERVAVGGWPALSHDGRYLVYGGIPIDSTRLLFRSVTAEGARGSLYLREMETGKIRPLPGTEGGLVPAFSPDGESIAFIADQQLKTISLRGGEPVALADARFPHPPSWTADERILFQQAELAGLAWVAASGGAATPIPRPDVPATRWPSPLPGLRNLLVSAYTFDPDPSAAVVDVRDGSFVMLPVRGRNPRYVPTGHLVAVRRRTLMAAPFDLDRLEVTGAEVSLIQGVGGYGFSEDGTLVYVPRPPPRDQRLVAVDRQGNAEPLRLPAVRLTAGNFKVSPDGTRLAVTVAKSKHEVWVYDLASGRGSRLTTGGNSGLPVWTPDGERIIWASDFNLPRGAGAGLFRAAADGSGSPELLHVPEVPLTPSSISPDGRYLAAENLDGNIVVLPLEDGLPPAPFPRTDATEWSPEFSPDGRFVAYTSDETGIYEIYVRPFPRSGDARWMVSTEGGEEPLWSPDGKELYYRNGQRFMRVPVRREPEFRAGTPEILFEGDFQNVGGMSWAIHPDGETFVMLESTSEDVVPTRLNVVLNWFEELERLVPTGK